MSEKRTLLAVFAHPDEESFGPGGTLARYAAEGVDVHLVCATNSKVGVVGKEFMAGYCDPADRRIAELRCAASQLGLSGLHLLGYRDSGMAGSPENSHPDCLAQADLDTSGNRSREMMARETVRYAAYDGRLGT